MIEYCNCPMCHQGQVAFRLCQDRETVVLLCQECALVWLHPQQVGGAEAIDLLDPNLARRYPQIQLRTSRWATSEEIHSWGWSTYLKNISNLLPGSEK